jgi:hypothetical protein
VIWALLAFVGVPLWLCAVGIFAVVYRNRALRTRHGDIPVRVLRPGKSRWVRGHAVWVSQVFAWRGSPAAWNEDLELVVRATLRSATPEDMRRLHRMGDDVVVAELTTDRGVVLQVAASGDHRTALLGPLAESSQR